MTTPEKGKTFGPADSENSTKASASAATIVDVYCNAVVQTGKFPEKLDGAPDLLAHQTAAKANANDWLDNVRTHLYAANTNLGAYADKFQNFYHTLYKLAGNLTDPNKVTFTKGLNLLKADLTQKMNDCQGGLNELKAFNTTLDQVVADMATDNTNITAKYDGDQGELKHIQEEINAANDARNKDMSMIAGGATLAVVGGLMIAVGVLAEIETAGVATGLVVAGVAAEAGAGTMIGIASADITKKDKLISQDTARLKTLTQEVTLIHSVSTQLTSLQKAGKDAENALDGLLKQWQVMDTQLDTVISAVGSMSVDDGPFLQDELNTANDQWGKTMSTCNLINQQLKGIPVKKVSSSQPTVAALSLMRAGAGPHSHKQVNWRIAQSVAFGAVVDAAAADSSAELVVAVNGLNAQEKKLQSIGAPPASASVDLSPIHASASSASESVTAVASSLSTITSKWVPLLEPFANGSNTDLCQARSTLKGFSDDLNNSDAQVKASNTACSSLNKAVADGISSVKGQISHLDAAEAGLKKSIANLQEEVHDLQKQIDRDRAIGWIFGPIGHLIEQLVTNEKGKEEEIDQKDRQMASDEQQIHELSQALAWCQQMLAISSPLASQAEAIQKLLEVLDTQIAATASESTPDDLEKVWLSSQLQTVLDNLNKIEH